MAILLSEMRGYAEVAETISREFGISETREHVWRFARTQLGRKLIPWLRVRFLNNISKIPIANKSVRLERLQKVYQEAMTESLKSRGQFGDVYELKLGAAIEALKAAREEVEGSHRVGISVSGNGKVIFQDIDIKTDQKRTVAELIRDTNNRLAAQFEREPALPKATLKAVCGQSGGAS